MRIVLLLLVMGCGAPSIPDLPVPEEVKPYYARFGITRPEDVITVEFVQTLPGTIVGTCYYSSRRIFLRRPWWNVATTGQKLQLVMHELFHCVNRAGHDETIDDIGRPSVMRSVIFTPAEAEDFLYYFDYYMAKERESLQNGVENEKN